MFYATAENVNKYKQIVAEAEEKDSNSLLNYFQISPFQPQCGHDRICEPAHCAAAINCEYAVGELQLRAKRLNI